jgi:hypothetical protein
MQIKNLMSTAYALATEEKARVTISYLKVAIAVNKDFEGDFKGVRQIENLNVYY